MSEGVTGRRGWQLPDHEPQALGSVDAAAAVERVHAEFVPTLRGAVWGYVSGVSEGTVQTGDHSKPVVTLRLERNEAHEGRTSVSSVRLSGGEALGFAKAGDLVEAVGSRESAYLVARDSVNHTTGAVYHLGRTRKAIVVFFAALVAVFIASICIFVAVTVFQGAQGSSNRSNDFRQQQIQHCLAGGGSRAFCESIP